MAPLSPVVLRRSQRQRRPPRLYEDGPTRNTRTASNSPPAKRRRRNGRSRPAATRTPPRSFLLLDVPVDCRLLTASYLDAMDLSSLKQVNRRMHDDLTHVQGEILLRSQRTWILDCQDSIESLLKKLLALLTNSKKPAFQHIRGLYIRLIHPKQIKTMLLDPIKEFIANKELTQITSLHMEIVGTPTKFQAKTNMIKAMCLVLPRLHNLNLHNIPIGRSMLDDLSFRFRSLRRIRLYCHQVYTKGPKYGFWRSLKELAIADHSLFFKNPKSILEEEEEDDEHYDIFKYCRKRLEKISIKHVRVLYGCKQYGPLSQTALVKLVRSTPQLRWFRSDLTPQNIQMLQQERPEITFISE